MDFGEICAVVMAAGLSRRMGDCDKLLLPFRGKALLAHTLELVAALPFARRVLVTTPARRAAIQPPAGVVTVLNHSPERGQSESLKLGLLAAGSAEGYLFFTADQPLLDAPAVRWLVELSERGKIAFPTVDGRPATPSLFPAWTRESLLALTGDAGGRAVRAANPGRCQPLEVREREKFLDIDTPEEYQQLQQKYD